MKLIVGLGNSHKSYLNTRHNIGRLAIERFADKRRVFFSLKKSLFSYVANTEINGEKAVLAYPDLFMNESGKSLKALVQEFQVKPLSQLMVIVDDLALPFGRLRLRLQGSSGGHNGLKSIESFLQSSDFARLRIGIDAPIVLMKSQKKEEVSAYVTGSFDKDQKKTLPDTLEKASLACEIWLSESPSKAMAFVSQMKSIA